MLHNQMFIKTPVDDLNTLKNVSLTHLPHFLQWLPKQLEIKLNSSDRKIQF